MRKVSVKPQADPADLRKRIDDHLTQFAAYQADPENAPFPTIQSQWYKRFRDCLLEAFHWKCAYCEISLVGQEKGDVEHFRPKLAIVDDTGKQVVRADGKRHSGYWWLAYEWGNLLPACKDCNGTRYKGNKFPVDGVRAEQPGQADNGKLINPLEEDPAIHLTWNTSTGQPIGRDERGDVSIGILGLHREKLRDMRLDLRTPARKFTRIYLDHDAPATEVEEAKAFVDKVLSGERAFSAFLKAVIIEEKHVILSRAKGIPDN